ncbi:23S rRNA (uracil(1939)-C(5))-methyltransferase RlmD [Anaerosphaera multitolerans]|uniref:23S rRNA (Uracil(1939)-C(5))-methyltransferase RlmD n=1 Tax=Anaerosphaera multitolerans TaxID=2487351 RepID=A0A437SAB3_9FIRM|nr:23S rRNA (uracil(1939)-C(5))-methyltransferase RlmD [Anaerosphaera multitolerans]RVU55757.1 23S rRNA (uracil(1939)-C(5))-methyltransferase RlmD [Anaerosphaera multitolerans]
MTNNKVIVGKVESVKFPNKAVIDYEGNKIEFKGGILGQTVEVRKVRRTKGKLLEVIEKSPLETEDNCIHSKVCGGCTYQTLNYRDEVEYKKNLIEDLFKKEGIEVENFEFLGSPHYQHYRNKMEYTFSDEYKEGPLSLGLHMKNKFYEVVNTMECNIVHEDFNIIRAFTRDFFAEKLLPYNKMRRTGTLRHLLIRRSSLGEILINIVTTSTDYDFSNYFEELLKLKLEGSIVGLLQTKNDSPSDAIVAEEVNLYYGRDYIYEEILGLKFKVSVFSFFQTNTQSAEVLYSMAKEMLGDLNDKVLLDLYSGTGTITQILGQEARRAIGIEIVEESVEAAIENVKLNNLDNVKFICGDVFQVVKDLEIRPNIVVVDPPREGINPRAIDNIINFNPEEFLYISCNPITLVRDLKVFLNSGYKLKEIKGLDQFPRTNHVEAIALIQKM